MRQHGDYRSIPGNAIQILVSHNRPDFKIISWHPRELPLGEHYRGIEWLPEMNYQQRRDNTTRGLTPGLINPAPGEAGGRVSFPSKIMGAGKPKRPRGEQKEDSKSQVTKKGKQSRGDYVCEFESMHGEETYVADRILRRMLVKIRLWRTAML